MKRWFLIVSLLIGGLVLQATVFNYLTVAGVKPDILLIIVILYGLLYGKKAAYLGTAYGLVEDLLAGRYLGFNAITKGVTGLIVGIIEPKLFKDHVLVPIFALLFGTFVYGNLSFLIGILIGVYNLNEYEIVLRVVILQSVYNACLVPFFYGRYYKIGMGRFVKKLRR